MKSIGFFGDSFCADRSPESWCNILSRRLGCDHPVCFGGPGESIWSVFFKFNELVNKKRVPDISVFCWTEPYRLYHPKLVLTANVIPRADVDPAVYKTLDNYWRHLHSYAKDELCYEYALKYYDQNILSQLKSQIIQTWSFRPFETANKDVGIRLQSGCFIDESMLSYSGNKAIGPVRKDAWWTQHENADINHMTAKQNQQWADRVYSAYKARY